MLLSLPLLAGCGHHKQARHHVPPPPDADPAPTVASLPPVNKPPAPENRHAEPSIPPGARAIWVEEGLASWYGPPYHNRRGSNGEIYDMNGMTAAHRTLPLGSVVRVTNVKTGHTALLRITDRGPFVPGRVIDLSLAAAKQVDVWLPGTAKVRIEVMQAPSSLVVGGRWAVQMGAFKHEGSADQLVDHLARRYQTAKVTSFPSPIGDWWVRVRVDHDDKHKAEEVARDTHTPEGSIFLVRLD